MTTDAASSSSPNERGFLPWVDLGSKLFKLRDYTPVPLIILLLFFAEPSVGSATLGLLLIGFGEAVRLYSVAFIGSVSRTRNTSTVGGGLVRTGPFGMVRNPLYVGNFFITIGVAVFGGVPWLVVLTFAAFAFQYHAIVKHEESLLRTKFGAEYEDYLQTVPAWVPARLPALETWEWPTTFSPALKSERRTLTAILIMVLALVLVKG